MFKTNCLISFNLLSNQAIHKPVVIAIDEFQQISNYPEKGTKPFYSEYRSLLTRHQWQLLKAIAHSGSVSAITSGDFIRRYSLTNASTVKRGIDALIQKEMIYQKDSQYFVYDVFFSRWLETLEI
jgi:hypothetical protein